MREAQHGRRRDRSVIALSCGRAGPHQPGTLAASSERLSVSAGPRPPGCRRSLLRGGARSGQQPQMRETLAGSQEPAARPRSRSAVERKRRFAVPMEEFVRPLPWAREPLQVAPSSEERVEIRPALRPLLPRWQVVKPELMAQRELSTRPAAAHTRLLTLPVRVANLERRQAAGSEPERWRLLVAGSVRAGPGKPPGALPQQLLPAPQLVARPVRAVRPQAARASPRPELLQPLEWWPLRQVRRAPDLRVLLER